MLHTKNLGVTKGASVLKIQPRCVCSRGLFLFLCIFSGTEVNSVTVQSSSDHQAAVTFFCFTYVILFASKCGYKGCIMHHGWATFPFRCVTSSRLCQTHKKKCKEYVLKCREKKKTALIHKSLHVLLQPFRDVLKNIWECIFLSSTKAQSKNSDGSRQ